MQDDKKYNGQAKGQMINVALSYTLKIKFLTSKQVWSNICITNYERSYSVLAHSA
jgi:hypothetical protein